jgi:hypothetical protein
VAGYTYWLDANAITGVADNTALQTWPDGSANHYDFGQSTVASRPTYYKTTAGQLQNGKPVVVYPATRTYMYTAGSPPASGTPVYHLVFRCSASATSCDLVMHTSGPLIQISTPNYLGSNQATAITGGTADTAAHVLTASLPNGNGAFLRLDGTQIAAGNTGSGTSGAAPVYLGVKTDLSTWWQGAICEVVYYSASTLTLANLQANEAYLKAKWGTP